MPVETAKRTTAGIAAIALALVGAACGSDQGGEADPTQDPAATGTDAAGESPADSGDLPLIRSSFGVPAEEIKYLMIERPELAENLGTCYDIEWLELAGNVNAVQALVAGTVDAATVGGLAGANGIMAGGDMVMIGEFIEERSSQFSTAWVTRADSGIESAEDLEGKIVANSGVGSSTNIIETQYLSEFGLEPDVDYETVTFPFGQQQENLEAGRIDVGVFPQPFFKMLMESGDYNVLWRVTDVADPFIQLTQAFSRDFVDANREAAKCFVEDFESIAMWMEDEANRDEVIEVSAEVSGLPADLLDSFLLTEEDFYRPSAGALNIEGLQANWDLFYEVGAIDEELNVMDYVDEELLSGGGND